MSMNEKETANVEQTEKYVTKYDRKMQKREELKKKQKKEDRISTIIGVLVVVALAALVASFPIRNYMAVNENYIQVAGEKVTRVEFDYNYNIVKNNYLTQYGDYLSYFGLDTTQDLATQQYTEDLSWKDYFEQMAVESIITTKALTAEGQAAGFTYDDTEEYAAFEEMAKQAAENSGVSTKEYISQFYGPYATMDRIEEFAREAMYANAYYAQVSEGKGATDDEIQSYYEENKVDYDSVDYYLTTIKADIPTEPTELADPVEETTEETAEGTDTTEAISEDYQPSEAEIEKAMSDAKALAEEAVATEGELQENIQNADAVYVTREWLFDESRQEGDTTIIEDTSSYSYYVLSFVKRYRDEAPSADVRMIAVSEENDGQAIIDEWKAGDATAESFGALADKYNEGTSFTAEGGLYQAVTPGGTLEELVAWIFDEARAVGDVGVVDTSDGTSYVLYYAGPNDPEWKLNIADVLLSETMTAYLETICDPIEVVDEKGKLNYLKVEAATEEATDVTDETVATDATAETDATTESTAE